jgi:hypothetical protein
VIDLDFSGARSPPICLIRDEPTYSVRFDAAELWGDGQRGV